MGCGASRLDPNGEGVPARLRPILQRRLEEIKRRRHSGILNEPTTQSKKQLLKVGSGVSDEETYSAPRSHHDDDHKSVSSHEDSAPSAAKRGDNENGKGKHDLFVDAMTAPSKAEVEAMDRNAGEDSSDDYNEERRIRQGNGDRIDPGSPSFRVYFVESLHDSTTDDDENDDKDDKSLGKVYHGETTESKNCAELLDAKKMKKTKKGGFRRAISKGRANAVKNLLHITSCYSVPCSGHHHTNIPVQKEVSAHVR